MIKQQFLKECIDSVINQSIDKWELIVVYDGDNQEEYIDAEKCIKSYGKENIFFYSKDHNGQSAARNFGIKKAKGNLISFLDCDDTLSPIFVEVSIKYSKIFPNKNLFFGFSYDINRLDSKINDFRYYEYPESNDFFFGFNKMAFNTYSRCPWAKVFVKPVALFDEKQPCIGEDILYIYESSLLHNIVCVNFISYFYRTNEASVTHVYKPHYLSLYLSLIEKQTKFAAERKDERWTEHVAYDVARTVLFSLFKQVIFCKSNPSSWKDFKTVIKNDSVKFNIKFIKLNKIKDKRKRCFLFFYQSTSFFCPFYSLLFI